MEIDLQLDESTSISVGNHISLELITNKSYVPSMLGPIETHTRLKLLDLPWGNLWNIPRNMINKNTKRGSTLDGKIWGTNFTLDYPLIVF